MNNNEQWALFFECADEVKLNKVRAELETAKIPYTVINKKDRTFLIGEYEVYVSVNKLSEAKQLLKGLDVEL